MRPARATVAGHFGELLQGRLGPGGPLCLVTLPVPCLRVAADVLPGSFGLHCAGGRRIIDGSQAAALVRAITRSPARGRVTLRASMPAGGGAGSSTAALVAVARVMAQARRLALPDPERLARLCLGIEGATDPLMFPHPARLLWDPRAARILAPLPEPPALDLVGGFLGPGLRTDPADLDFADVSDLAAFWAPAAARGDLRELARIATQSALRNVARRGGPDPGPLLAASEHLGALGIVTAHTGSARGLIFPPGARCHRATLAALRAIGLREVRHFRAGRRTGGALSL